MQKKLYTLSTIAAALLLQACVPASPVYGQSGYYGQGDPAYQDAASGSYQEFYDELSPYGNWLYDPDYGYVWSPNVAPGFQPYATNGQWVYSDYGWTWASNYSWGWAPFHYGRWFYQGNYGWLWVPGSEWAPAWVTWGQSPGYYGWAPLPPRAMIGSYNPPAASWIFVQAARMASPNIGNYRVNNGGMNISIIRDSGRDYNRGPQANEVERNGNFRVKPVTINAANRPGSSLNDNRFDIYRPSFKNSNPSNNRPAPRQVQPYNPQSPQRSEPRNGMPQQPPQPARMPPQQPNQTPPRNEPPQAAPDQSANRPSAPAQQQRPAQTPQQRQAPRRDDPARTAPAQPANRPATPAQQRPTPQRDAPPRAEPAARPPAPEQPDAAPPPRQEPPRPDRRDAR